MERNATRYSEEFKLSAIALFRKKGKYYPVAKELKVPRSTLQNWVKKKDLNDKVDQQLNEHAHHWMLDTPNGPITIGTCKICHEDREFYNSIDTAAWPALRKNKESA